MIEVLIATQIALSNPANPAPAEETKRIVLTETISPSEIPIQVSITHKNYDAFFEKASQFVGENSNECAKFVNRIFLARFGKIMFGNAWDLQIKTEYSEFLQMVWKLKEDQFNRDKSLSLKNYEDRIDHFREIYSVLDNEKFPIGIAGFVYTYSFFSEYVGSNLKFLPQTHVAFVAGRKSFLVENDSAESQSIEQIFTKQYGNIHDFERSFINEHIPLDTILVPGGKYFYNDYLIEEHFRKPTKGSLLTLFLRKHKENRMTPLLRPVSFSRISDQIIFEIEHQNNLLADMGNVDFVRGEEFENLDFWAKDKWIESLKERFNIKNPSKSLLVPVPAKVAGDRLKIANY